MSEDNNIVLTSKEPSLGEVRLAPEVIEVIIGIAASQVDGVYSMRGSIANSFSELLGRQIRGKGVKVNKDEDQLKVDVYVFLNYGVSVPKVAAQIQEKVRQQVLFMTGIEILGVDVHVQGVIPEKQEQTIDPNNLFGEENGERIVSISRHDTRKMAFQALFALNSNPMRLNYKMFYEALLEDEATTTVPAYLPELVEGVLTHQSELRRKKLINI